MRQNLLGYAFLLPAVLVMALCGVLPMAFVAYYSVHDTFGGNIFIWVGAAWFKDILASPEFHAALARSLGFSALVLAIEDPLGHLYRPAHADQGRHGVRLHQRS